jgi:aldehyde:ferredoxin oxidoreductase
LSAGGAGKASMNGYMGKLLRVDLTTGRLSDEPLNAN